MKKTLLILSALLLTAAILWTRGAWAARKNLVTLSVAAAPLSDVLRQIGEQTRERVIADSRLQAPITLNVRNMPLLDVLDLVGEQTGGWAMTVHAIHGATTALGNLEIALAQGATNLAGWSQLAPSAMLNLPADFSENTEAPPSSPDGSKRITVVNRELVVREGQDGRPDSQTEEATPIIRIRAPSPLAGGAMVEEQIIPERIVMENPLLEKTGLSMLPRTTRAEAEKAAGLAKGRCTTIYALKQSATGPLPVGAMKQFRSPDRAPDGLQADRLVRAPRPGEPSPDPEKELRKAQSDRYRVLTPEQRAERSRQKAKSNEAQ